MTATSFFNKLEARVKEVNSHLCIGLDPHSNDIAVTNEAVDGSSSIGTPQDKCDATFTFCKTLIDATLPYAACYKPNSAFFEALGDNGPATLVRVLKEIPSSVPILLDVKRGDIGSTATAYAEACYDHIGADSVTLSPLMGWDSVAPFVTGEWLYVGSLPLLYLCRCRPRIAHAAVMPIFLTRCTFLVIAASGAQGNIVTREPFYCAKRPIQDPMNC